MMLARILFLFMLLFSAPAFAVSQSGNVVVGDCPSWSANQFIQDGNIICNNGVLGGNSYVFRNPTAYLAGAFNGTNSQVIGFGNNLPTADNPSSVCAWVKSNVTTGGQVIHSYGTNSTNQERLYFLSNTGQNLNVGGSNFAQTAGGSGNGINDGNYHEVCYTYQTGGTVKFYKDSVQLTTTTSLPGALNTTNSGVQYLGQTPAFPGNILNANEQMVQVFNITLSQTQINALYNGGLGTFTLPAAISSANLITEFKLNGNNNDTSGSGNTDAGSLNTYVPGHILTGSIAQVNLFQYDYPNNKLNILLSTALTGNLAVSGNETVGGTLAVTGQISGGSLSPALIASAQTPLLQNVNGGGFNITNLNEVDPVYINQNDANGTNVQIGQQTNGAIYTTFNSSSINAAYYALDNNSTTQVTLVNGSQVLNGYAADFDIQVILADSGGQYSFYGNNFLTTYNTQAYLTSSQSGLGNGQSSFYGTDGFGNWVTLNDGVYAISSSGDVFLNNGIFLQQTDAGHDGNGSYFLASTGFGFNIGGSASGTTNIPFMQATQYQVTNSVPMWLQPYAGRLIVGVGATDDGTNMIQAAGGITGTGYAVSGVNGATGSDGVGNTFNHGIVTSISNFTMPKVLATVTGVNAKTIANTALYTVPGGKSCVATSVTVRATAQSGTTSAGPIGGVGNVAGTNNIFASQSTGIVANNASYGYIFSGTSLVTPAAGVIYYNLGTGATGAGTETIAIDLLGYCL